MSYPISALLGAMNGHTVTEGWDAVVAYSAAPVNDLFAQQYVANVRANQDLPPINATIPVGNSLSLQVANLTLGPPLISFTPSSSTQEATVTMNFIAGSVVSVVMAGDVPYVSAYQSIVPGDEFQLQMIVELTQLTGTVQNTSVLVNLTNAQNFTANLLGPGAGTLLGEYFQALFKQEAAGTLTYQLGTLQTGTDDNLNPQLFDVRTQPNPYAANDGAVLLFVATTYNPNAPSGWTGYSSGFPYLVPDGFHGAVVVASSTLFQHIIGPGYQQSLGNGFTFTVLSNSGTTPSSYLSVTGGSVPAGPFHTTWSSGGGTFHVVWSGTDEYNDQDPQQFPVPFSGITVAPGANDTLSVNWSNQFSVPFCASFGAPRTGVTYSRGSVSTTVSAALTATMTISPSDVVTFSGTGAPAVSFQSSSWLSKFFGDGNARDAAGNAIVSVATPVTNAVMAVQVPQVNAFAVSHLLFPSENVMQFSEGHLPGDLALFGQIAPQATAYSVTPLQAVVAAGQTQQFTAANAPSGVTWSINPRFGTISSAGLYTAPAVIAGEAVPVVVTGTSGSDVVTAVVVVVPSSIALSPAFTMVSAGAAAFTIAASVLGNAGSPAWSIDPSDGSLGTIDQTGLYTPPASVPTGLHAATVTATAGGDTATSLVCVAEASIAFEVDPHFSPPLTAGQTQQFTVTGSGGITLTWSIAPNVGTITQQGLYTAPSTITSPQAVVVMVQDSTNANLAGVGLVLLAPAAPAERRSGHERRHYRL